MAGARLQRNDDPARAMRRLVLIAAVLIAGLITVITSATPSSGAGGPYLVTAIFDNAGFAVPGEQVRIAGAPVGSIQSVGVTTNYQAAVTLAITNTDFRPWYANATCAIRPQSLIAERYVDCEPGSSSEPALARITNGVGAGTFELPVTQTTSPIDFDIVQDISQDPVRQRLSIILDELGTGLAAQGASLNAVIHRADPALGDTDQVFKILAHENHVLAALASDSETALKPLARVKQQIAGFIVQANTTAVASAQRAGDTERSFKLLPTFLGELRPLMVDLGRLAQQGTPLMASVSQSALATDRQFAELIPFAKTARPALLALAKSAHQSQPSLIATESLARRLNRLGTQAQPAASLLNQLTASLNETGAIEQLMGVLFDGTGATNGFDADGHYVRAEPLVGGCTAYKKRPVQGCSANFGAAAASDAAIAAASASTPAVQQAEREAGIGAVRRRAVAAATVVSRAASIISQALTASTPHESGALTELLRYLIGGSK
jgi:phospholipid/cholesterol/gamma-HCH transport system substrate-binding protein